MGRRKEIIQMHQKAQSKRNPLLLLALALLVLAVAIGGTIAWLTASNHVTNTFTVGEITQPVDPDRPDPDLPDPDNPDNPENPDSTAWLKGNIYEIFDPGSVITPGGSTDKKPWIGIGKDSKPSYVFAYVDNKMMAESAEAEDSTYFILNNGWAAVQDKATAYAGVSNAYTGGLFKWVGTGNNSGSNPAVIGPSADAAVWTNTPIFNNVVTPDSAIAADFADEKPKMDVYCFLYAAVNGATPAAAQTEAIAWAEGTGTYEDNALAAIVGEATATNGD